jgi:para-aminobenzoate synthetase component 1
MEFLDGEVTKAKITHHCRKGESFLFGIDFRLKNGFVLRPDEAAHQGIFFDINGKTNQRNDLHLNSNFSFEHFPVSFEVYQQAFNNVMCHLQRGDTYLLNLTFPTPLKSDLTLKQLFQLSRAPYKLVCNNQFLVFSPESFVKIDYGIISSYPMKGTIDASLPDAEKKILENEKEFFEHNTIVDLIRNDLSMVSTGVKVKRFRYIDRIVTNRKELLQVSSEISGNLPSDWTSRLGEILFTLLPAGSVTGAPKEKTVQIISETETYERGFYTGICGYFDGKALDSGVMIRFIENIGGNLVFKSGGGITALSDAKDEHEEMIHKVYVPVV